MARIRSHNEGSVYQNPNGKWRAQVSIDGRRLSFTAKSKKEALAWILETKNQIDKGLTFQATDTTLKEFLSEWLTTVSSSIPKAHSSPIAGPFKSASIPILGM